MASGETTRLGVCNLCEAICGLELTIAEGSVTAVRGNPADPLSRGYICPKGVSLADIQADPDRLRRPVRRLGRGADAEWVEIAWNDALDLTADGLARAINGHGRDAVGVYLGNPNAHALGSLTHGTAMVRGLRTRNRFSATSVDQLPHQLVSWQLYGHQLLLPVPDLDRTSYLLVIGANPMASNGSLMTAPDFPNRLRALQARGGQMVVLDPRRTETAKRADEHLFVRPGSDAAVVLAMVRVLLTEGLARPAAYVDGVERLRELVEPYTPEVAQTVSGIPAADLRRLAHDLAAADGAAVYGRVGVSTQGFGSLAQWGIHCLNILSGNFDQPGGVLFAEPAIDLVSGRLVGRGSFGRWRSRVRGAPEYAGELPAAVMREEIVTPGPGQVRAMLTIAGNPVLSTPDGGRLGEAFAGLEFMASVDIYLNETTRHADVILPPTTALERDHYDIVFHMLAVRNTARFTPAVLPKPDGAWHDWEIYRELALRVQRRLVRPPGRRARLQQRLRLMPSPTVLVACLLRRNGVTSLKQLRRRPQGIDLGPLRPTMPRRLQTADHRVHLAPALVVADLPRLRAWVDERRSAAPGGLVLIGRRHQQDNNAWFHNIERVNRGKRRHHLLMHPDDLADRGIADGDLVTVSSRVGAVTVDVRATDDVMRGVVSLPHGYGHQVDGVRLSRATTVPGASINDLTDPDLLDVSGNAALSGVPVTVARA